MSDRQNEAETNGAGTGIDAGSDRSQERTDPTRWRGSRRRFLGTTAGVGVGAALGVATAGTASAQADGATVYIGESAAGGGGGLYAVDAATGQQQWEFTEPGRVIHSSPTAVEGTIYVGGGNDSATTLYAIDAATGQQEWAFTEPGQFMFSSPTVIDGTAYVGADDANLYAVDAATGQKEWTFEAQGRVNSSPQVIGGTVYFGAGTSVETGQRDSTVYAVDAETGEEEWQFTEPADSVLSSPIVGEGTLYVGSGRSRNSNDSTLYAVDAATGTEEWRFTEPDTSIISSPVLDGNTVYFGTGADLAEEPGNVYAVNAETGDQEWVFTDPDGPVVSSPTVWEGTVYVGYESGQLNNLPDSGSLYAVDAETGQQEWEYDVGKPVFSSPTAYGGTVYVGAANGNLYAFDAETGNEEWIFTDTSDLLLSSPTIVTDPDNGDSVGTRVTLGTLGHNQAWPDDGDDDDPDAVDLSLQPVNSEVQPGAQQTYELVVEGATNGIGSYDATITVGDTTVAEITDARAFQTSAGLFDTTIADDGSSVQFAGLVQFDAASQLTLAEIDVAAADTTGETSLDLSVADIADSDASSYRVESATGAMLTVSEDAGPPPLPDQDNAPQDLDGDGLYEDVNGDDQFSIADVQIFFQNRDSDAVQNNPEAFNFDETDPPEVSIGDVQALFQLFQGQNASGNADEAATEEGGSAFGGR